MLRILNLYLSDAVFQNEKLAFQKSKYPTLLPTRFQVDAVNRITTFYLFLFRPVIASV